MIYIPRLQWKINNEISFNRTSIQLTTGYTGHRYASEDNAYWLEPYSVSSRSLSHRISMRSHEMTLTFSVVNPEDVNYEVIAGRPVAGRIFKGAVLINLHSEKQE